MMMITMMMNVSRNITKGDEWRCHRSAAESASAEDDDVDRYEECNTVSPSSLGGRNAVDNKLFSLLTDSPHSDLPINNQPHTHTYSHFNSLADVLDSYASTSFSGKKLFI